MRWAHISRHKRNDTWQLVSSIKTEYIKPPVYLARRNGEYFLERGVNIEQIDKEAFILFFGQPEMVIMEDLL